MAQVLLRLGAYQILHLDRIPAPIAGALPCPRAQSGWAVIGLINGVLRRVTEANFKALMGKQRRHRAQMEPTDWLVGALRTYADHALEGEAEALNHARRTPYDRP